MFDKIGPNKNIAQMYETLSEVFQIRADFNFPNRITDGVAADGMVR